MQCRTSLPHSTTQTKISHPHSLILTQRCDNYREIALLKKQQARAAKRQEELARLNGELEAEPSPTGAVARTCLSPDMQCRRMSRDLLRSSRDQELLRVSSKSRSSGELVGSGNHPTTSSDSSSPTVAAAGNGAECEHLQELSDEAVEKVAMEQAEAETTERAREAAATAKVILDGDAQYHQAELAKGDAYSKLTGRRINNKNISSRPLALNKHDSSLPSVPSPVNADFFSQEAAARTSPHSQEISLAAAAAATAAEEAAAAVAEAANEAKSMPMGCTDCGMGQVNGKRKLLKLDGEGDWRMAGTGKLGYGFELTQDKDDQEGHLLCRVPFKAKSSEVHVSLEYVMEPKSAAEGGGQGMCVYLVDPSVAGWDRHFDGTGPLGFVGKSGAIVGVGIDCTGEFCQGKDGSIQAASIAIKRANDGELLCDPVQIEGGVVTRKEDFWRKVKVKFDIVKNKCDVTIGDVKVLDDIKFDGVTIPKTVCVGVCAGTTAGKTNRMCVNKVKIKAKEDWFEHKIQKDV